MEKEIKLQGGENLETVVYKLLAAKSVGEKAFCVFGGHVLHSDTVTMASAYKEVMGYSIEEAIRRSKDQQAQKVKELKIQAIKKEEYARLLNESRAAGVSPITMSSVIDGLKFLAENQNLSQEEILVGLLDMGINYNVDDLRAVFTTPMPLFKGMKRGDLASGATVLVNARDSETGRAYVSDAFLANDDKTSIYNYIRKVTKDKTYTKENIQNLNSPDGISMRF